MHLAQFLVVKISALRTLCLVFVLFFSLPLRADEDICSGIINDSWKPEYTEVLGRISENYKISVIQVAAGTRARYVILAGESHVKSEEAYQQGVELLSHFPHRGLEAADFSKYWLPSFLEASYALLKMAFRIFSPSETQQEGTLDQGSTIDRAAIENKFAERIAQLAESFGSPDQDTNLDDIVFSEQGHAFTRRDVLNIQKRGKGVSMNLEEGHAPNRREKLEILGLTLAGLHLPVAVVSWAGVITAFFLPHSVRALAGGLAVTGVIESSGVFMAAHQMMNTYERVNNRNKTMDRNIKKTLREHPEVDILLVLVGRNHVDGLKELLLSSRFSAATSPNQPAPSSAIP